MSCGSPGGFRETHELFWIKFGHMSELIFSKVFEGCVVDWLGLVRSARRVIRDRYDIAAKPLVILGWGWRSHQIVDVASIDEC
jgi:hypothetical protein